MLGNRGGEPVVQPTFHHAAFQVREFRGHQTLGRNYSNVYIVLHLFLLSCIRKEQSNTKLIAPAVHLLVDSANTSDDLKRSLPVFDPLQTGSSGLPDEFDVNLPMLTPLLSFLSGEGKPGVHVAVAGHAGEDGSARNTHGSLSAGVVQQF